MANYASDVRSDLTNVSLTPEQMEREEFERDFRVFITYLTSEDWVKVYKCIDILLDQHTSSCSESSSSGTLELSLSRQPENVKTWSVTQNAINFTWSTTKTPTPFHQSDVPPKIEKRVQIDAHQSQVLEEIFSGSQYVVGKKRRTLAEFLGLTEKQVGHWFECRRRRMRYEQSETNGNMKSVFATSVCRQPKQVGAHLAVKQDSFDTGYVCSSNVSTGRDVSGNKFSILSILNSENTCPNTSIGKKSFL